MKNTWKDVAGIDDKQTGIPKGEQNRFSLLTFYRSLHSEN
jgi:hypothetical protein